MIEKIKPFLKPLFALALIAVLVLGNAQTALAARTGGRIGGGSFRAPTRTYTSPGGGGYRSPGYGYGYGGGGFGFPFLIPFFGFGGGFGGLFSILIFIAIANFLVRSFRSVAGGTDISGYSSPKVSVAEVQVGLLARARDLQPELNELARTADTGTAAGRAQVLQEATLALLRHPEYWVYGAAQAEQASLEMAEAKFNQLALGERSKFTAETLSNVNAQLSQAANNESSEIVPQEIKESGEYIVATIVVGVEGRLNLPAINSAEDLQQTLRSIGAVGSDRLLAVEILWTPQAEGDTLSTDDLLAQYPNLKLV